MKRLKVGMLLLSIGLLSVSSGCARQTILRPITAQDIYKDGENYCFSPEYLKSVLEVKIDEGVR